MIIRHAIRSSGSTGVSIRGDYKFSSSALRVVLVVNTPHLADDDKLSELHILRTAQNHVQHFSETTPDD